MAEPTYREIQLSVKQLVFGFMSAVVVLIAVFLLGISVGRGVGAPDGIAAEAGAPSDTMVSTEVAPTEVAEGELTYHDDLQGRGAAGAAGVTEQPALPSAPPPQSADPVTPAPVSAPPAAAQAPPPAAAGDFVLQLGAFGVRPNADRLVEELKQKGYAAFIARPESDPSLFAVRVGPFQTRAQAEGMQDRLARDPKRYKSSILR